MENLLVGWLQVAVLTIIQMMKAKKLIFGAGHEHSARSESVYEKIEVILPYLN